MSLYYHVTDGEWIAPVRRGYQWQCCDCGLVHRVDFRIERGQIQLRVATNHRATAQVRRWRKKSKATAA